MREMSPKVKTREKKDQRAELVMNVDFSDVLKRSYLEYSLSVILSRALPDVRDGLKPVQRRILWAMYELGLYPNKPFKKCAAIVGEVLGRYHPHGDTAVYEALVRMAQDFNMRYPLIEGQGNFGSLDGDPPAAYRYTEARLSKIAMEMLRDIDLDTVDFRSNFDNTAKEPTVLPAAFPNLLVNGSTGIAVGMSTSIPPHNLADVVSAIKLVLENPKVSDQQLIKAIVGPDFPTGGVIVGTKELIKAYRTGKGLITIEGKYQVIEERGKQFIVITEIPYGVNKAKLVESIANKVRDKKIIGINDIVDSSDKEGVRIIIELKPNVKPDDVVNQLRKYTDFRTSFLIQLIAVNGHNPKLYTLKELITEYLAHRREVIRRRTEHKLQKAKHRSHLLEGLVKLLDALDLAIELIRDSESPSQARERLMDRLGLTEVQANYILGMQLQQLTRTQREEILKELEALRTEITSLSRILSNPQLIDEVIKEELDDLVRRYPSPRRTTFYEKDPYKEVKVKEKVESLELWITPDGYYALSSNSKNMPQEPLELIVKSSLKSNDNLGLMTSLGQYFWVPLKKLPETSSRLEFLGKVLNLSSGEKLVGAVVAPKRNPDKYLRDKLLLIFTNLGKVKGLDPSAILDNLGSPRRSRYIKLDQGEAVVRVVASPKEFNALLLANTSYVARLDDIPVYGKNAKGVVGIKLKEGEELLKAWVISPEELEEHELALLTLDWRLVIVPVEEIPLVKRGSRGKKLGLEVRDAWLYRRPFKLVMELMDRKVIYVKEDEIIDQAKEKDGMRVINLKRSELPINQTIKIRLISDGEGTTKSSKKR